MRPPDDSPRPYRMPPWLLTTAIAAVMLGIVGLIITAIFSPSHTWAWLVVCFVYFTGVVNGILAWAVIFRTSQTQWTAAINRLAHSCLAYVPVMATTLVALLIGVNGWVTWLHHPVPEKAGWLNVPFMVVRDVIALGVFWTLCLFLVRWSLVADAKAQRNQDITPREHYRLNVVAVAGVLVYSVITTIISYDFIMSLAPEWYSTVFGPYFFSTNVYAGMAVLILMSAALRGPLRIERYIGPKQFQDMGNLMLGFGLFDMGLFFAQYLTIWYENLPQETFFLVIRYLRGSWPYLGWTAFFLGYAIPFVILQSRHLKKNPRMLSPVAVMALVGVALERYVLVVPSIHPNSLMLFPTGLLIILGFIGTFVLATALFLSIYRPVSAADADLSRVAEQEVRV